MINATLDLVKSRQFSVFSPAAMNILFDNTTDQPVPWFNFFPQKIVVLVYDYKGSPVRTSRLLPAQSFSVQPGYSLKRIY